MTLATNDKDINDVFDSIALAEEKISDEAFKEGFIQGEKDGKIEGYHLGYHKGTEVGTEIGFYEGVVETLNGYREKLPENILAKLANPLQKLKDSLEAFPKDNSSDVDILAALETIRAHYKKVASLSKLNLQFQTSSSLSF